MYSTHPRPRNPPIETSLAWFSGRFHGAFAVTHARVSKLEPGSVQTTVGTRKRDPPPSFDLSTDGRFCHTSFTADFTGRARVFGKHRHRSAAAPAVGVASLSATDDSALPLGRLGTEVNMRVAVTREISIFSAAQGFAGPREVKRSRRCPRRPRGCD